MSHKIHYLMIPFIKKFVNILLLFCLFIFLLKPALGNTIDDLKKDIAARQTEIEELEKQAKEYKKTISQKEKMAETLDEAIRALDEQVNSLKFTINITQRKIEKTALAIQELELKIIQKIDEIEKNKKNMAGILRTLYETDHEGAIEMMLKYERFSDLLNQINYTENLQNQLQTRLDALTTSKIGLEAEKSNLGTEKENLVNYQNDLGAKQSILSGQKTQKNNLLITTQREEKRYKKLLADAEAQRQAVQKEIFELEDKLRFTIDPSQIPKSRPGLLTWPSEGKLTQKYGPTGETGFINDAYQFHNGIDWAAGLGASVKAAKSGIIKAIGDNGEYAYGKWIAIEHDNGLTTLYAHLSLIAVKTGQKVSQGQTIGYEGSTGFSTGSHLHFTVYATHTFMVNEKWFGLLPTGGHINPMDYL